MPSTALSSTSHLLNSPCRDSGGPHDVLYQPRQARGHVKVGAVDVERVLLSSGFKVKELSRGPVVFGSLAGISSGMSGGGFESARGCPC